MLAIIEMKQLHQTSTLAMQAALPLRQLELSTVSHPDGTNEFLELELPRGFKVEHLHVIFDIQAASVIRKDEFINGMFRLVHNCCIMLATSEMSRLYQTSMPRGL